MALNLADRLEPKMDRQSAFKKVARELFARLSVSCVSLSNSIPTPFPYPKCSI